MSRSNVNESRDRDHNLEECHEDDGGLGQRVSGLLGQTDCAARKIVRAELMGDSGIFMIHKLTDMGRFENEVQYNDSIS